MMASSIHSVGGAELDGEHHALFLAEALGRGTVPVQATRAARSSAPRISAVSFGSAWSWPRTWSTPCTTSRASSSS